ncbi:MAG: 7-cyano-7-deazaguanine synthase QueC [Candidatus Altiarchaeota archaeon]|nr:7-cyano-7-deazaguanine synthase QueC [Candidatus Altiarchaeota archaeon]
MKAVVLLSGGLDSAVTAYIAKAQGYDIYALTFDYGQRHRKEIEAAKKIVKKLSVVEHKILSIDLTQIGGSALTSDLAVPQGKSFSEIKSSEEIPVTYVPARNTILLSCALGYAEVVGADAIFIGANHMDYSGYPDCRPEYFAAFQDLANLATKRGIEGNYVEIKTPIINLDKKEIILKGAELNVPFELTWSCYVGGEKACGKCDSCTIRLAGFKQAGLKDKIKYNK